jgi:LysM repeat protein
VEEIMELNRLRSTRLQVGQILKVPLPSEEDIARRRLKAEEEEVNTDEAEFYTIRSGDNPWLIAIKHRMKLDDLLRLNDLDEVKARRLKPGDRIRIR